MYLRFSDGAKFADMARNLVNGLGYGGKFNFWSDDIFSLIKLKTFPSFSIPPVMPLSIAAFFKAFGVSDFSVVATSFFYFILTLIFVFLLARKIFKSNLTAVLSTLAVGFNYDIINYATTGASESPFIFEIVAAAYFISVKKKWADVMAVLFFVLLYFTRPQAFIYIAGLILFYLLDRLKVKRAILCFAGIMILGLLFDYFILLPQSGQNFMYSVIGRGFYTSFSQTSVASNTLRGGSAGSIGGTATGGGHLQIIKNILYNLYNFYKLTPQIMSPYLFALFVIDLFVWGKDKLQNSFKAATIFMFVITFLVAAASIPFYRYLHPIIPLIYIIAVGTLVEIINKFQETKLQTRNHNFLVVASCILVFIFVVGQTLGTIFLDSRFEASIHNTGKPPVYVVLGKILKVNTDPNQIVITNLDTWGTWYGERETVWFPLEPKQIIDPATGKIPFDAIYLTSYLIDDQNYYMGIDWRMIFNNPNTPSKWTCDGCAELSKEFTLKGVYKISANDDYERQDATGILLIKK